MAIRASSHLACVIACGPHGYQGAGRILSSMLRECASLGHSVTYVGQAQPTTFTNQDWHSVRVILVPTVNSAAIGAGSAIQSQDVLLVFRIANAMVAEGIEAARRNCKIIVWGSYTIPYCAAAVMAGRILYHHFGKRAVTWTTPTGSDIWEVGPQLHNLTKAVLTDEAVSCTVVYSRRFADELVDRYGTIPGLRIIKPAVYPSEFRPPTSDERATARRTLDIPPDAFTISCHCNMRPVKRPWDVIEVASAVGIRVSRPVVLLMIGPKIDVGICRQG